MVIKKVDESPKAGEKERRRSLRSAVSFLFDSYARREREIGKILLSNFNSEESFVIVNPSKEDIPIIAKLMFHPDASVRAKAVGILFEAAGEGMGVSGVAADIIRALRAYPAQRLMLINALSSAREDGADISPAKGDLFAALDDCGWETRYASLRLFREMVEEGEGAGLLLQKLNMLLNDRHEDVRKEAASLLSCAAGHGEIDKDSLVVMRRLLGDNDAEGRDDAIFFFAAALANDATRIAAYNIVEPLSRDDDPYLRESAARVFEQHRELSAARGGGN